MGAANCCPPQIEPTTPDQFKARRILQGLTAGLLPVAGLALAAADQGFLWQFFMALLMALLLYMGWRSLNWCSVMFFMLYCMMPLIQTTLLIAG